MKKYVRRRTKKYRRKRKGKSFKFARKQQRSSLTYIRKKYTKVFNFDTVIVPPATTTNFSFYTVSLIGGENSNNPNRTITLFDVNQDGQLTTES